jgi:hypothetical protein
MPRPSLSLPCPNCACGLNELVSGGTASFASTTSRGTPIERGVLIVDEAGDMSVMMLAGATMASKSMPSDLLAALRAQSTVTTVDADPLRARSLLGGPSAFELRLANMFAASGRGLPMRSIVDMDLVEVFDTIDPPRDDSGHHRRFTSLDALIAKVNGMSPGEDVSDLSADQHRRALLRTGMTYDALAPDLVDA